MLAQQYLRDDEEDDELVAKAEEVLGFGVSWVKSLLDNPAIWVSDMLFSDRDSESTSEAEEYLEKAFFTEERVHTMLRVSVTQYLILTKAEIALWNSDPVKFYHHMKF